jgi:hypothetical protein
MDARLVQLIRRTVATRVLNTAWGVSLEESHVDQRGVNGRRSIDCFGEKGSMENGMIHSRDGQTTAGTYVLRVKT